MDCELSHLIGAMEEVVEMTGANKSIIPQKRKTILPVMISLKPKKITNPKIPLKRRESLNVGTVENLVTGLMNALKQKRKLIMYKLPLTLTVKFLVPPHST